MTKRKLTASDRGRFRVARTRGEARRKDPSAVVDARYDRKSEALILTFGSGASMTIPRGVIPGLGHEPVSALETVVLSPSGDALRWPLLDADVHLPGLVECVFGSRLLFTGRVRSRPYGRST
jgi:hypothetical protein